MRGCAANIMIPNGGVNANEMNNIFNTAMQVTEAD